MEGRFIIFYLVFYSFFLVLGFFGADMFVSADAFGSFPELPDDANILEGIDYAFSVVVYFFGLGGLAGFGVPVFITTLITTVLTAILAYVVIRLIRGGG